MFEHFLAKWIIQDISANFDSQQYGNSKECSTTHYLIDLLNYIGKGLDQPKHYAQLCTTDFTKAFDRVNHRIVIEKLVSLGVRKSIVSVICSFLMDRTQNT